MGQGEARMRGGGGGEWPFLPVCGHKLLVTSR